MVEKLKGTSCLRANLVLDDLRVIDMFEDAAFLTSDDQLEDRKGNWVQKFHLDNDASLFALAQFSRYQDVEKFIEENLQNQARVLKAVKVKGFCIPMILSQIKESLHLGQSNNVEFIAQSQDFKEIGPIICGFLNTSGGYVIYGVDNEGKSIGIRESNNVVVKKFKNNISELISPKAVIFLQIQNLDGKKILIIEVLTV